MSRPNVGRHWSASALKYLATIAGIQVLLTGCVVSEPAVIRTAQLQDIPSEDCVFEVLQKAPKGEGGIARGHTESKRFLTGTMESSAVVFDVPTPLNHLIAAQEVSYHVTFGTMGNAGPAYYEFSWLTSSGDTDRESNIREIAKNIEAAISLECRVPTFTDRVVETNVSYSSAGLYR